MPASEWRALAASLHSDGWWLADLCGLDCLGLTRNFPGAAARGNGASPDDSTSAEAEGNEPEGDADSAAAPESGAEATATHPGDALDVDLGNPARFHVVAQFLHRGERRRRMVHVLADGDHPTVATVADLWPGATNFEREAYDMFGIVFEDHPALTRILMPDEWEGHPLRKDYGVGKVEVDFAPQPLLQIEAPGQSPTAGEAGVRLDHLGQVIPNENTSDSPAHSRDDSDRLGNRAAHSTDDSDRLGDRAAHSTDDSDRLGDRENKEDKS